MVDGISEQDEKDDKRQPYLTKAGARVPSVTTVIKSSLGGWGLNQLMAWAVGVTKDGEDYRTIRDEAGSIGSVFHRRIESFITGKDLDLSAFTDQAIQGSDVPFESFLGWYSTNDISFNHLERRLVSEIHLFGGTLDADAVVNGKHTIIDYKSSKSIYASIVAQFGGYQILTDEEDKSKFQQAIALHCSKEGEFGVYTFNADDIQLGVTLFHHARSTYKIHNQLQKRLKEIKGGNEQSGEV